MYLCFLSRLAPEGVLQRADPARAHAHLGRPVSAQLRDEDLQVRARGEHPQLHVGAARPAAREHRDDAARLPRRVQLHQPRRHLPQRDSGPVQAVHQPVVHLQELHAGGAGEDPGGGSLEQRAGLEQAGGDVPPVRRGDSSHQEVHRGRVRENAEEPQHSSVVCLLNKDRLLEWS